MRALNDPVRSSIALSVVATLLALIAVASTYSSFDHTWDEPAHLAAGMQWLDTGNYTFDNQHPPLARIFIAALPWMSGLESTGSQNLWSEGLNLLYSDDNYHQILFLSRIGILPFLILLASALWCWANRWYGPWVALGALVFTLTQPTVLAHAGLATTDLAMAATSMLALLVFSIWITNPVSRNSIALGAAVGLAFASKYSAVPFLGSCFLAALLYRWHRLAPHWHPSLLFADRGWLQITVAAIALFITLWLCFGLGLSGDPPVIPAVIPSIIDGIQSLLDHNSKGHWSYLLGEKRQHGWWYFFPVTLSVKATIPLLVLFLTGLFVGMRKDAAEGDWRYGLPGIMALSILAFSLTSNINIGVRHVLLIFPLMSVQAAIGARELADHLAPGRFRTVSAAAVLCWQLTYPISAYPDYLSWFNIIAGDRPERILINGDLDWGQDVRRLTLDADQRDIPHIGLALNGLVDVTRHPGMPPAFRLEAGKPITGWIAVSIWRQERADQFGWLRELEPVARVGQTIDLYFVSPDDLPPEQGAQAVMREALQLRYRLGNPTAALALFTRVIELNPRHYGALWQRAYVLEILGRKEEAEEAWLDALVEANRSGYLKDQQDIPARLQRLRSN